MLKCLETWLNKKLNPPAPEQITTENDRHVYRRLASGFPVMFPFRSEKDQKRFKRIVDAACGVLSKDPLTTKIQFVTNAHGNDLEYVVCSDFAGSKQRMMTPGEFIDDVEFLLTIRAKEIDPLVVEVRVV